MSCRDTERCMICCTPYWACPLTCWVSQASCGVEIQNMFKISFILHKCGTYRVTSCYLYELPSKEFCTVLLYSLVGGIWLLNGHSWSYTFDCWQCNSFLRKHIFVSPTPSYPGVFTRFLLFSLSFLHNVDLRFLFAGNILVD